MKAIITYIYHNCFTLKLDAPENETFIFDYPSNLFLQKNGRTYINEVIRDKNVYIFISHRHTDHFNFHLSDFVKQAPEVNYILSADVLEFSPQSKITGLLESKHLQIVEPEKTYHFQHFDLHTLQSNDEGVAFLIQKPGVNIYFGGDLADWDWDDWTVPEREQIERIYHKGMTELKKTPLQIAFVNTDPRLPNWAGALDFLKIHQPQIFVPMHLFGRTKYLKRFLAEVAGTETLSKQADRIFHYRKTGDTFLYEF